MGRSDSSGRNLIVVALPSEDSLVRRYSSEREPHLTLLYLKDVLNPSQLEIAIKYVQHAASMMQPFGLDVVSRGELGEKKADVLFFNKKWAKNIESFRSQLLQNDLLAEAYLSEEQFPEWVPHLTMGYPSTPAKKMDEDHRITYVDFDRIAVWVDEYSGPTFRLEYKEDNMGAVAMSQIKRGRNAAQNSLQHYGVKGMKWGVRRSEAELARSSGTKPRVSEDVKSVRKTQEKINKGGTQTLSNQELRSYLERMDLERRFSQTVGNIHKQGAVDRGHNQAKKILAYGETIEKARKFLETPTGQAVKTGVMGAAAAAAAYATGGASAAAGAGASIVVRRAANHYTNVGN